MDESTIVSLSVAHREGAFMSPTLSAVPVGWVEGFHFVDKRVRAYKFAPTVYDNNTMMKLWLAQ
jgi:hypothetical protein